MYLYLYLCCGAININRIDWILCILCVIVEHLLDVFILTETHHQFWKHQFSPNNRFNVAEAPKRPIIIQLCLSVCLSRVEERRVPMW